jgi:endonuclease/exonuclease/phosphatase family metal-dependent hydrolase
MLKAMHFTVASYNIHKCAGLDRRVDLDRIAQVLEEIDADMVGLQEVFRPQALRLAERLGVNVRMGPTRERDGLPYGNAVLTRLAVRSDRVFDLSQPDREPRGGIRLDLTTANGLLLHVFNVHFGLRIRERAEQVRMLVREHILHDELTGPRIVVGDLNEWFPGAVGRALRRELTGPRIRRTHPAPLPLFPLDRIYWDRGLGAEGFRVHRSRLSRVASDHLPVVARLRLAPPRG